MYAPSVALCMYSMQGDTGNSICQLGQVDQVVEIVVSLGIDTKSEMGVVPSSNGINTKW